MNILVSHLLYQIHPFKLNSSPIITNTTTDRPDTNKNDYIRFSCSAIASKKVNMVLVLVLSGKYIVSVITGIPLKWIKYQVVSIVPGIFQVFWLVQ